MARSAGGQRCRQCVGRSPHEIVDLAGIRSEFSSEDVSGEDGNVRFSCVLMDDPILADELSDMHIQPSLLLGLPRRGRRSGLVRLHPPTRKAPPAGAVRLANEQDTTDVV